VRRSQRAAKLKAMNPPRDMCCDMCNESTSTPVLTGADLRVGVNAQFTLHKCRNCGLVSLQPAPSDSALAPHYPDFLWENVFGADASVSKFDPIIRFLKEHHPAPGRLLDVGCGPGDFVLAVEKFGWQASGIEISQRQVDAGVARGAALSVCADFLQFGSAEQYDAITFNHVLEHVRSPRAYLRHARKLLSPSGTLIIAVPNFNSLSRRIFGAYWMHADLPRHLFHFTPRTLTQLLKSAGFRAVQTAFADVEQDSIGMRESLRRWVKYGLLHRPIVTNASTTSPAHAQLSFAKRAVRYVYRTFGNGAARIAELAHVADTFTIIATPQL
jgi:SAM-dependent methyltransferase